MESIDRKKEIINICLDTFIENGLSETSVRDLSKALNLQPGGIYYYFEDKDEAVVACAEEAALRLENALIIPALKDINDPDRMIANLYAHAEKMKRTMKFFSSVCALSKYEAKMEPTLDRLTKRYDYYVDLIAKSFGCAKEDIEPYVYITITSVANYMVFSERAFVAPQMTLVKEVIKELNRRKTAS